MEEIQKTAANALALSFLQLNGIVPVCYNIHLSLYFALINNFVFCIDTIKIINDIGTVVSG